MTETLPELRETEAPPATAAIYAEIRAATGLPFVNLAWRHLATLPGALPWAWNAIRPLSASGLIAASAERVCANLPVAAEAPIDAAALAAVGVHDQAAHEGLPTIRRIVDAYNRGNAANLVALTALLRALERGGETAAVPQAAPAPRLVPLPSLPPLPRLSELDERARQSVLALAEGHAGADSGAVPSLYLHLAYWPGFLDLARGRIEMLPREQWRERARELAGEQADGLAERIATTAPPAESRDAIESALRRFAQGLIPEMLPVGLALARALPR